MGGARRCQVIWEADDKATIDEDAAVDALEEAEDETLAGVTLHFKHGGSVSDLHKYRERRRVYVAALPDGRVSVPAIEKELREYLSFLRDPGFDGPIDSNGILHEAKLVQQKK